MRKTFNKTVVFGFVVLFSLQLQAQEEKIDIDSLQSEVTVTKINLKTLKPVAEKTMDADGKLTDLRDGSIYRTREFGDAGRWMLENLSYIPSVEDGFLPRAENFPPPFKDKAYCYPQNTDGEYSIYQAANEWDMQKGILYNWAAATNNENKRDLSNQGQGSKDAGPKKHIQGICPEGWHLPNDKEWNDLEREIYNNPEKYSSYSGSEEFDPAVWNPDWESGLKGAGARGSINKKGHALAMISDSVAAYGGTGHTAIKGGFDVLLAGGAGGGVMGNSDDGGSFWTSSSYDEDNAWGRNMTARFSQVYRNTYHRLYFFSVRCKKD